MIKNKSAESPIPLEGRYHDGPLKCIESYDSAGDPVYSRYKVPFGNCSGALEVYYSFGDTFFKKYMTNPLKPLAVLKATDKEGKEFIDELHSILLDYHISDFKEKGIDPSSLAKPTLVMIGNWLADAPVAPSCGIDYDSEEDKALLRRPVPHFDIFVADVDYGSNGCWAVGSLIASEKVLQAEFNLSKPDWLDQQWYNENILEHYPQIVV